MTNTNPKKNKSSKAVATTTSSNNMAIFEAILGTHIWKKSAQDKIVKVPLQEALKNKEFVALYFGGQFSSVSTQFTPELVKFYQQATAGKKQPNQLEIIYVSSDQSQEEFDQHYGIMPWAAAVSDTPEALKKKNELIPLFKAFRAPCMVVLHGPTGTFVTEHGVRDVTACMAAFGGEASEEKKDDDAMAKAVQATLDQWRTLMTKSIQDAHKLIDYGGGTVSALNYLYKNPYLIVIIVALVLGTSILKKVWEKPAVLIGFLLLGKRYLTPRGDQNLPGTLVKIE